MELTLSTALHIFMVYLYSIDGHFISLTHILALLSADWLTKLIIRFSSNIQCNILPV